MCPGKTQSDHGYCDAHAHLASGWSRPGRGTAEQRGYDWAWRKKRAAVLKRDRYLCQCENCKGCRLPASEVDHVIPKHLGGTDDFYNLAAINSDCHRLKTQREALAARLRT
ncbi:HNH endonuclease [Pseudomonas sp. Au-Pse12]|uniref:HNH endonuclease n=1 Tax=Pseudomonas sp. Au-Pse12 TaxID=2906459 RepID=UPI001E2ADB14|nr:HNH endonuclease signature motif containing protein [Pseudomonas sp. Au-Pse12]MCE4058444.1 HNH endonuclease [Pseudomonas sp. Au-Pse12]